MLGAAFRARHTALQSREAHIYERAVVFWHRVSVSTLRLFVRSRVERAVAPTRAQGRAGSWAARLLLPSSSTR
eukprot:5101444-Pleurochrysis_carterae.AAC.2